MSPHLSPRTRTGLVHPRAAALSFPILFLIVLFLIVLAGAGQAHAANYRFWAYYQWTGSEWQFSAGAPEQVTPTEGSVEGWRFAVAGEEAPRPPRAAGDFDRICADTPAEPGRKRVAVIIDYGTPEDAPDSTTPPAARGACAVVPTAATGSEVLSAVAQHRIEGGLVCGIDGYPATGCGDLVDGPAPTAQDQPVQLELPAAATDGNDAGQAAQTEDDGPSLGVMLATGAAGLAAIALVVGAVMQARRTRT
jgi:hypothetical protein